jgi:hypothetical protein
VVTEPAPVATSPDLPKTPYEVGVYVRYLFVTSGMMAPFLAASTDMNSASVGAQFIYKYSKFDVVTSLDFSYLNLADGNYLAADHPADLDTHYTEFRNLSFLSVDVSLIGHTDLGKWLELRYGGGLGLGVVMGDVLLTNSFNGCTTQNVSNVAQCHPLGVDLTSPDKEAQLKATENGMKDTAGNPHRHPADKPPVMGVVNLLIGLRVKLPHKFSAQAEIGFRDALFVGAGANYRF